MNATHAAKLSKMEKTLSAVAGAPVEITIRGEKGFTWSLAERNEDAAANLATFATFYPGAKVETHHDDECGSFVYVDVA